MAESENPYRARATFLAEFSGSERYTPEELQWRFGQAWRDDGKQVDGERTYEVAGLKSALQLMGYDTNLINTSCQAGCLLVIKEAMRERDGA